ncbi:hypothetical protein ISN44_As13g030650, partial [Arabidopsis suecica]
KPETISSKSEVSPTLITSGRRSGVSSSSPPKLVVEGVVGSPNRRFLAYEIGDNFSRSSSFVSKSVTIGL